MSPPAYATGGGERAAHAELLGWRREFPILERTTYLISNSLGAMPRGVRGELERFAAAWDERGVRAWSEGWWEMAVETGDLLAPVLGVLPGEISMHQNVTLAVAGFFSSLDYPARRPKIVTTELNFPSLLYLLAGEAERGAEIVRVPSADGLTIDGERLLEAIDERTRLVNISHVLFKSGAVQDAVAVARRCRETGALLLLDVYQSAGSLPLALADWGVDAAAGGSVKWLCGGPGAAFLWVRPELAARLAPRLVGWQADREPFSFHGGPIRRADGAWRFLTGTPNVPALHSCRPGYRIVAEIGVERIRRRSLALTDRMIAAADAAGIEVRTPRPHPLRGGTVTFAPSEAGRLCERLLERRILCDYRPGAGIRMAPHFYNTEQECDRAVSELAALAAGGGRPG